MEWGIYDIMNEYSFNKTENLEKRVLKSRGVKDETNWSHYDH
jgi:hypothetical protein